jgi:putative DNA primase/helicase
MTKRDRELVGLADAEAGNHYYSVNEGRWRDWNGSCYYWEGDDGPSWAATSRFLSETEGDNGMTKVDALLRRASMDERFRVRAAEWDTEPWDINTPEGLYDLSVGTLHPHSEQAMADRPKVTKCLGVTPKFGQTPIWNGFMRDLTCGDQDYRDYLQRLFGYWLTGDTKQQKLWFFLGAGRNGKSVLLSQLRHIMGDYAINAAPGLLVVDPHGTRHPTELADLAGVRIAFLQEMNPGDRLDVAKVKMMTGEEELKARWMRGDFFTFKRQFKLGCACNDLPDVAGMGLAERRRIVICPFNYVVPEDKVDLNLLDKLKAEAPAIAWNMLRWASDYVRWGLDEREVDAIREATADYLSSVDDFGEWLRGNYEERTGEHCSLKTIYDEWEAFRFAEGVGEKMAAREVGHRIRKSGYATKKIGSNTRVLSIRRLDKPREMR